MRIVIAPNAFKNSLPADEVALAIEKGLQQSHLECDTTCLPIGDGGDGTASLLIKHLGAQAIPVMVHDPLGRLIEATYGIIGETAIIEMADASGLRLLQPQEYNPMLATTYGTGELVKAALDKKVKHIIIGIGGSATVDGGTGIMQALGAKFYDVAGNELGQLPASLNQLKAINLLDIDPRIHDTRITVLCDVENTLLGTHGAAKVFGPQKGASAADVLNLEAALERLCNIVYDEMVKDMSHIKHGGAAGGVAAALHTFFRAELVQGIDYFLELTGFNKQLETAHLVITGEGSIDRQTLDGKGPYGVAKKAKEKNIPVIGIAGKVPLVADEALHQYFDVLLPITNEAAELVVAMPNSFQNLVRTARALGDLLSLRNNR